MGPLLYIVTAFTTLFCAVMLLRAYWQVRRKLLLWSGLCFAFLTLTNILNVVDLALLPEIDLFTYRLAATAFAMLLLLFGLIWERA